MFPELVSLPRNFQVSSKVVGFWDASGSRGLQRSCRLASISLLERSGVFLPAACQDAVGSFAPVLAMTSALTRGSGDAAGAQTDFSLEKDFCPLQQQEKKNSTRT